MPPKLISTRHRIRVQLLFWTAIVLLVTIALPVELRLRVAANFVEKDLADRTDGVISKIAAYLKSHDFYDTPAVEDELNAEVDAIPSIVELTVLRRVKGGADEIIATTADGSGFSTELLKAPEEPLYVNGPRRERLRIIAHAMPGNENVMIMAVTSLAELDRFVSVNRFWAFVLSFSGIAVVIILMNTMFQRKVVRPIGRILSVMGQARDDEYEERVPVVNEDEIGLIAASFNTLMEHVKEQTSEKNRLIQEVRRLNEGLQQKVRIATAGLIQKNSELERTTQEMIAMQDRLIHAERLATAGQMAATFAHEIGSPLASLSAHAEMLLEDENARESQKAAVAVMHKQIVRMTEIVDDLLRTARRGPEDFVAVNLVEVLDDVVGLVAARLKALDIQVASTLPDTLWVRGYPLYLQEIFLNLVNNSADAIERNGHIEFAGGSDSDGKVWIEVRDDGPGIDPKVIGEIWKSFVTTRAMRKGSGLGLAVVRDIVRQHGGSVDLKSSQAGTIVRVTMPALKAHVRV